MADTLIPSSPFDGSYDAYGASPAPSGRGSGRSHKALFAALFVTIVTVALLFWFVSTSLAANAPTGCGGG